MITVSKFNVRIVNKGDKYGFDFCLTHDEDGDKAMVEFYDARHANTANKFGYFVSRYYVGTLLCKEGFYGNSMGGGLCLDGGNPDEWSVEAEDMKTVLDYISGVAA
jgi:hypothetical protein